MKSIRPGQLHENIEAATVTQARFVVSRRESAARVTFSLGLWSATTRRDGFEVLISLLKEDEQPPRYDVARAVALGFRRYNIPVKDFCPPTVAQLEHFLSLIATHARLRRSFTVRAVAAGRERSLPHTGLRRA
jgi:hypothetical protein